MKNITEQEYRSHARRSLAELNYFRIMREMSFIMSKMESYLLADLINREHILHSRRAKLLRAGKVKKAKKIQVDDREYFRCTRKFLMNPTYPPIWTVKEQKVWLKKLKQRGFIKTEQRGGGRFRWVWIDYVKINKTIDTLESELLC